MEDRLAKEKFRNSGSIFASFLDSLAPIAVIFCFGNLSVSIIWSPWAWGVPLSQRHSVWWGSSVIFALSFLFAFSLAFAGGSSFGMVSCLRMAVRIGFALAFSLSFAFSFFLTLLTVFTFGGMSCVVRRVRALTIPRLVGSIWPRMFSWTVPKSPRVPVGIRCRCCASSSSTSTWRSFWCFWPPWSWNVHVVLFWTCSWFECGVFLETWISSDVCGDDLREILVLEELDLNFLVLEEAAVVLACMLWWLCWDSGATCELDTG